MTAALRPSSNDGSGKVTQLTTDNAHGHWLVVLRRYLLFTVVANFVWEAAQMPLYILWQTGTAREIAFAVIHCTGGDVLITLATLAFAVVLFGDGWPTYDQAWRRVAALTTIGGATYTVFSEWLNIVVRKAWAYSDLMPVIPIVDVGLSPFAQWILIPLAAFWWVGSPRAG